MKKFIIALDNSNSEKNDKFLEYINDNNLNWWHWINNFWIVIDSEDSLTALDLRNVVYEIFKENAFVMEFQKDSWGGFGPSSDKPDGKNMFNWLHKNL